MSEASQKIHDMIQGFPLNNPPEMLASNLLDILQAMNERMDTIEATARQAADIAGCLANGIKPD